MSDVTTNTEPQTETQDVTNILSVTSETTTYAVYKGKNDPTDKAPGFGVLKEGNALWKKTKGDDPTKIDTDILREITVTSPIVHSIAGISEVVPDEEEAVNIFNAGADAKLVPQLRARFTALTQSGDFEFPEDTVTVEQATEILAAPLKRRTMSAEQKAVKTIKELQVSDPETLMAALRAMGIVA